MRDFKSHCSHAENQVGGGYENRFRGPTLNKFLNKKKKCLLCSEDFSNAEETDIYEHMNICFKRENSNETIIRRIKETQEGNHIEIIYQHRDIKNSIEDSIDTIREPAKADLLWSLGKHKNITVNYKLTTLMTREVEGELEQAIIPFWIQKRTFSVGTCEEINAYFEYVLTSLNKQVSNFIQMGSGWVLSDIIAHELYITGNKKGEKGGDYISPPEKLKKLLKGKNNKTCAIIPKTSDKKCFVECLTLCQADVNLKDMASENPFPTSEMIKTKFEDTYNHISETLEKEKINFPLEIKGSVIKKIKTSLKMDKHIQILAYDQDNNKLYSMYKEYNTEDLENISTENALQIYEEREKKYITLLYYSRGDIGHFGVITDFSTLFYKVTKTHKKKYICRSCFSNSISAYHLLKHE